MTYRSDQWISAHTHKGIRDRLIEENTMVMPRANPSASAGGGRRTPHRGSSRTGPDPAERDRPGEPDRRHRRDPYGQPSALDPSRPLEEPYARQVTLRLVGAGDIMVEQAVPVRLDSNAGQGDNPLTGLVDVVVPVPADLAAVEL
jgi:hypothetical protein